MWFRRDLRLNDNAALFYALKDRQPVLPFFIFDRNILDELEDKADKRVEFIHGVITELQSQLTAIDSSLEVYYGYPTEIFKTLIEKYGPEALQLFQSVASVALA